MSNFSTDPVIFNRYPIHASGGLEPVYRFAKLLLRPLHRDEFPYCQAKPLIDNFLKNNGSSKITIRLDTVRPIVAHYNTFLALLAVIGILALLVPVIAACILYCNRRGRCCTKRSLIASKFSRNYILALIAVLAVSSIFLITASIIYMLSVLQLGENAKSNLAPNLNGQLEVFKDFSRTFPSDVEAIVNEHIARTGNATADQLVDILVVTIGRVQNATIGPFQRFAALLDSYKQKLKEFEKICQQLKALDIKCDNYFTDIVKKLDDLNAATWIGQLNRTLEQLKYKQSEFHDRISEAISRPELTKAVQKAIGQLNETIEREIIARISQAQRSVQHGSRTAREHFWISQIIAAIATSMLIVSFCLIAALLSGFAGHRSKQKPQRRQHMLTAGTKFLYVATVCSFAFYALLLAITTAAVLVAFMTNEATQNVLNRPKTAIEFLDKEYKVVIADRLPLSALEGVYDACEKDRGLLSSLKQKVAELLNVGNLEREATRFIDDLVSKFSAKATLLANSTSVVEVLNNITSEIFDSSENETIDSSNRSILIDNSNRSIPIDNGTRTTSNITAELIGELNSNMTLKRSPRDVEELRDSSSSTHLDLENLLSSISEIANDFVDGLNVTLHGASTSIINGTLDDIVENAGRCRRLFVAYHTMVDIVSEEIFDEIHGVWLATALCLFFFILVEIASLNLAKCFEELAAQQEDAANAWSAASTMSFTDWHKSMRKTGDEV